jgi:excisionase family DNA binding protein
MTHRTHAAELVVERSGPPLTTGALAVRLGVHRSTILRAIDRGELEALRLGPHGHYRIPADAAERWLDFSERATA